MQSLEVQQYELFYFTIMLEDSLRFMDSPYIESLLEYIYIYMPISSFWFCSILFTDGPPSDKGRTNPVFTHSTISTPFLSKDNVPNQTWKAGFCNKESKSLSKHKREWASHRHHNHDGHHHHHHHHHHHRRRRHSNNNQA